MQRYASERHLANGQELLTVMSEEDIKPETKKPHKIHWSQLVMTCFFILALAAAGKGFLYLDTEISTVESAVGSAAKDLNMVKAHVTATDTRERLATFTADIEDLKATNTQLRGEVEQIRQAFEVFKATKNNAVSALRKRR
jgi:uncharacterized membrane protein YvbJ